MDREAWHAAVHWVAKFWTRLSYWTYLNNYILYVTIYGFYFIMFLKKVEFVFYFLIYYISSVWFNCLVVSDSLRLHALQHIRLPCPSPTPGVHPNSCPLSQWCHPTISSSVVPFSSCLQSFPAWGSFQMSQFFTSGGQSIGVSASASVLPMNIQEWFPLGWTGLISLQSKGLSRVFSNTTVQKHQLFGAQLSSQSNSVVHWRREWQTTSVFLPWEPHEQYE